MIIIFHYTINLLCTSTDIEYIVIIYYSALFTCSISVYTAVRIWLCVKYRYKLNMVTVEKLSVRARVILVALEDSTQ